MITTIRSHFKQTTYQYVIFFMIFAIIVSMVSSTIVRNERGDSSEWAIKVNRKAISTQELNNEIAKESAYLAQIKSQYGQYTDLIFQSMGWSLDPKVRAFDALIREELLIQYAEKLGIRIHPDYIAKSINNVKFVKENLAHVIPSFAFNQAGVLDMKILNSFLQQNNVSPKQFEKNIEKALVQLQIIDLIVSCSYTPLFDAKQEFIAKNLAKQFSYLTFSLDQYLTEAKKQPVSNEELESFYNTENVRFRRYSVPEKRNAFVWKFESKNYNISISDEEIQKYYDENKLKNYVLDPLKIEVKIISSQHLAAIGNALSIEQVRECLLSNASCEWNNAWQSLAPFARGEHKGELENTAFLLQNEGDVSSVFESKEHGKAIIKLVRRIPRTYKPLSAVKNDIKNILMNKSFKKVFIKDFKAIVSSGDQKAIESFISHKSGKKDVILGVAKDNNRMSQELFALKVGSYAFYIENESAIVVQLTKIIDKFVPDLDSIKDIVKNDLYNSKAESALREDVEKATIEVQAKSFSQVGHIHNAPLTTIAMIAPSDDKRISDLEKQELPIRDMLELEKVGSIMSVSRGKNAYMIRLDEIDAFNEDPLKLVKNDSTHHLESMRKKLFLESFVASLHRNATIETNESIVINGEEYSK